MSLPVKCLLYADEQIKHSSSAEELLTNHGKYAEQGIEGE